MKRRFSHAFRFPFLTVTAEFASPINQSVVASESGFSNYTEALQDAQQRFPVNSTFACVIDPYDGEISVRDEQRVSLGLALFVIGCIVAAVFASIAIGTYVFALVSMRSTVPSYWARSKAWKEWWWMSIPRGSSDEEQQPEEEAEKRGGNGTVVRGSGAAEDFDQPSDMVEL